jgi:PST family polysaccharide transporter
LAVSGLLVRAPVVFWLATRRGPVGLAQIYRTLLPSVLAAIGVAGSIAMERVFVLPHGTGAEPGMLLAVPTGILAAVAVFWVVPRSRHSLIRFCGAGKLLWGSA